MPSAARRNSPKGGFGGASPPEFFKILQGNGANLDHPGTFKDYSKHIKNATFLTQIWKNIGEQRFMNHFYNIFFFKAQDMIKSDKCREFHTDNQ